MISLKKTGLNPVFFILIQTQTRSIPILPDDLSEHSLLWHNRGTVNQTAPRFFCSLVNSEYFTAHRMASDSKRNGALLGR